MNEITDLFAKVLDTAAPPLTSREELMDTAHRAVRRRRRNWIAALSAVTLLVGSVSVIGLLRASPTKGDRGSWAAAQDQLVASEREAQELLSRLPRPAGATDWQPTQLALNNLGLNLSVDYLSGTHADSLVRVLQFWQVGMTRAETVNWLLAHTPAGLRKVKRAGGHGLSAYDLVAATPASSADCPSCHLNEPDGTFLAVRVSALAGDRSGVAVSSVVWHEPAESKKGAGSVWSRPWTVISKGTWMRLTGFGVCPLFSAGRTGVVNTPTASATRLVPEGDPVAGLVCRYDKDHKLIDRKAGPLNAEEARGFARAVQKIQPDRRSPGGKHCSGDTGERAVIALTYLGRSDVNLWYQPTGCGSVSNGIVSAGLSPDNEDLLRLIDQAGSN